MMRDKQRAVTRAGLGKINIQGILGLSSSGQNGSRVSFFVIFIDPQQKKYGHPTAPTTQTRATENPRLTRRTPAHIDRAQCAETARAVFAVNEAWRASLTIGSRPHQLFYILLRGRGYTNEKVYSTSLA
jgi:hypothetical protein